MPAHGPTPSPRPRPASPAPRVRHLQAYACRIYVAPLPCKFRASMNSAISPRCVAFYPLPVRQASALPSGFLQTRSRPGNPCLRPTLPLAGRVEDSHLQVSAPCRAHQKRQCAKHAALHKPPASGLDGLSGSSSRNRGTGLDPVRPPAPVFSAVLTPQHFHEHEEHRRFFTGHFLTKGKEVAQACLRTVASLATVEAILLSNR